MAVSTSVGLQPGEKPTIGAFIAFLLALCFFSGVFYKMPEAYKYLGSLDFTTLIGKFGTAGGSTFVGKGGVGILAVLSHYGALKAAQFLMTPLLKPILGISGITGLALITDLQSTDAGAALTKGLYDNNAIDMKTLVVMAAWQYAGAGLIANYFSIASALFFAFLIPVWLPLLLMLCLKFVGGFLVRCVLNTLYRKDFA